MPKNWVEFSLEVMSLPEIIAFSNRQKLVAIAQQLLAGRIGVIEAARQIAPFRGDRVGLDEFDPDFVIFVVIESETDDLPVGETRSYWDADALTEKDLEIARCDELYRAQALEAASHLVARFAEEKSPESEHTLHAEDI
jgi:hypothetical protein